MSIIRLNNQSISSVTALPGGVDVGKIGQVVSTTKTDTFSTTANGASIVTITGLTASITPSSISSKILINVSVAVGTSAHNHILSTLFRDSTAIALADTASNRPRASFNSAIEVTSTGWLMQQSAYNFLDTPSSSSSLTYSVKIGGNGTATIYVNRSHRDTNGTSEDGRYTSTITLMEVLA